MAFAGAIAKLGGHVKKLSGSRAGKFAIKRGKAAGTFAMKHGKQGVKRLAETRGGNYVGSKLMGGYSSAAVKARGHIIRGVNATRSGASRGYEAAKSGASRGYAAAKTRGQSALTTGQNAYNSGVSAAGRGAGHTQRGAASAGRYIAKHKKKFIAGAAGAAAVGGSGAYAMRNRGKKGKRTR